MRSHYSTLIKVAFFCLWAIFLPRVAHADALTLRDQQSPNTPPSPISSLSGWGGQYWDNTTLTGDPVLERVDPAINFSWGNNAPDPRLPADGFSVRWKRKISVIEGRYRISVQADDGVRVYVDSVLLIDSFNARGIVAKTAYVTLQPGNHDIQVDYVDHTGQATIKVDIVRMNVAVESTTRTLRPTYAQQQPWQGEFFNNTTLSGAPIYTEKFASLNFNWGTRSPALTIKRDSFSARYSKREYFNAGTYRFISKADDGLRVYVDGKLIVNEWRQQQNSKINQIRVLTLTQGWHDIRVEYFDWQSTALLQVYWEQQN
jgi:hypothetical protein